MTKLVFDIETSALPPEHFDEAQQEYLFRECGKITEETARAARRAEIQQQFSLWPLTSRVVCIAMANVDSFRSKVLFVGDEKGREGRELPTLAEFVPCMNEAELFPYSGR